MDLNCQTVIRRHVVHSALTLMPISLSANIINNNNNSEGRRTTIRNPKGLSARFGCLFAETVERQYLVQLWLTGTVRMRHATLLADRPPIPFGRPCSWRKGMLPLLDTAEGPQYFMS